MSKTVKKAMYIIFFVPCSIYGFGYMLCEHGGGYALLAMLSWAAIQLLLIKLLKID